MFFYTVIFSNKFRVFFILAFFLCTSPVVFGQIRFYPDSAYRVAKEFAFSGKRAEARIILRKILAVNPASAEVQTLLGRTYSWDKKYDSARIELTHVLSYSPKNEDAADALLDTELWSDNYSGALLLSEKALKEINPRSEAFLLKKIRALYNLKKYKEALVTVEELLKINPKNEKAVSLIESIKKETRINKIGLSYDHDRFSSGFSQWTGVSGFYSRKTKYLGSVIGRVNYAKRFNVPGVQYETDLYPQINEKMYSYFNVGFSKAAIFPSFRFGFSLYRSFPDNFEGEIGIRYLKFNKSAIIYTGSVSKYISSFWFSLRPAVIPDTPGFSKSISLISRYYLKGGSENFITLTLSAGVAADQYNKDVTLSKTPNVGSTAIGINVQHIFLKQFIFITGADFRKDEYKKGLFRNNFNFSTGVEMFF